MSKYSDRLLADKKTQDQSAAVVAEAYAKATVEQEISSIKAKLATNSAASEAALGANPFSVKEVLRLQKEKAALSDDLSAMNTILTEQF